MFAPHFYLPVPWIQALSVNFTNILFRSFSTAKLYFSTVFWFVDFSSKMFFVGIWILTRKLFRVLFWYWILGPKVFNFYTEHFPSKQSKVDATSKKRFSNKFVASSLRRCLTWRLQPWTDMKNRLRLRLQCYICK